MKFERTTKQEVCRTVSERWDEQYSDEYWLSKADKQAIGRKLRRLRNPTPESIAAIIGNKSWTELQCDICQKDQESLVIMEGEYLTARVCDSCLKTALKARHQP